MPDHTAIEHRILLLSSGIPTFYNKGRSASKQLERLIQASVHFLLFWYVVVLVRMSLRYCMYGLEKYVGVYRYRNVVAYRHCSDDFKMLLT